MLLPQELEKPIFTKSMRGYDVDEVDEHIDYLNEKYAELYREADELSRKLNVAVAKLEEYRAKEQQINNLRIEARDAGNAIIAKTKAKCAKVMSDAEAYAAQVNAECEEKLAAKQAEITLLHNKILEFRDTVFDMYGEHINSLQLLADKTVKFREATITDDVSAASKE